MTIPDDSKPLLGPDEIAAVALRVKDELERDLESDQIAAVVLRVKTELAVQLKDLGEGVAGATGWTSIESRGDASKAVSEAAASLGDVAISLDRVADAIVMHAESTAKKLDKD